MKTYASNIHAERVGRWFSLAWRGLVRQDVRATRWMVDRGMSRRVAGSLMWIVKAIVLVILLYVALWLTVAAAVIFLAVKAAKAAHLVELEPEPRFDEEVGRPAWEAGEPTDHKQSLFYDPRSYNDDPDPRFYDPRFEEK